MNHAVPLVRPLSFLLQPQPRHDRSEWPIYTDIIRLQTASHALGTCISVMKL